MIRFGTAHNIQSKGVLADYAIKALSAPVNYGPCSVCGKPIVPFEQYDPIEPKITVHGVHTVPYTTEDIYICDVCFTEALFGVAHTKGETA